ncbi:MAG: hypothetical protein ACI8ZB_003293 [Desulforhopalus sp.]|jgi:hypothetical protein
MPPAMAEKMVDHLDSGIFESKHMSQEQAL